MKKIIILIIAIILPLVGAFMIGWYGIAVRYEPEKNTAVASLLKNSNTIPADHKCSD